MSSEPVKQVTYDPKRFQTVRDMVESYKKAVYATGTMNPMQVREINRAMYAAAYAMQSMTMRAVADAAKRDDPAGLTQKLSDWEAECLTFMTMTVAEQNVEGRQDEHRA